MQDIYTEPRIILEVSLVHNYKVAKVHFCITSIKFLMCPFNPVMSLLVEFCDPFCINASYGTQIHIHLFQEVNIY